MIIEAILKINPNAKVSVKSILSAIILLNAIIYTPIIPQRVV